MFSCPSPLATRGAAAPAAPPAPALLRAAGPAPAPPPLSSPLTLSCPRPAPCPAAPPGPAALLPPRGPHRGAEPLRELRARRARPCAAPHRTWARAGGEGRSRRQGSPLCELQQQNRSESSEIPAASVLATRVVLKASSSCWAFFLFLFFFFFFPLSPNCVVFNPEGRVRPPLRVSGAGPSPAPGVLRNSGGCGGARA